MDLPRELRVIHEPVRLRILGILYRQTDLGFAALRDALGLTPGNLASHAARLVEAGLVAERDALTRDGFEKRYQVTAQGLQDFERYLTVLDGFLAQTRGPGIPTTGPPSGPATPAAMEIPSGRRRRVALLSAMGIGSFFVVAETVQNLLTDASGSAYIGVGVAGGLVAALAPLEKLVRRWAAWT